MEHTRSELRDVISALGGDDHLCERLGIRPKTLLHCYDQRLFTASWYAAFCAMADERGIEPPPLSMFGMRELPPAPDEAA